MSMIKEFREFAVKGNVVDLAVGVIIGAAFGKIVGSAVSDIAMPLIGIFIGGVDFSGLSLQVGQSKILYGKFIQACVDFIIIAWVMFLVIKGMNTLFRKEEAAPAPPAPPSREQELLAEIRDLLKARA